jgi:hypothetical protein
MFSNEKKDWDDFVWKFEDFLSKMDGGRMLAEKTKLQALEMAMPSPIQNGIRLLKLQMDHDLVYSEMMQKIGTPFWGGEEHWKTPKMEGGFFAPCGKNSDGSIQGF